MCLLDFYGNYNFPQKENKNYQNTARQNPVQYKLMD